MTLTVEQISKIKQGALMHVPIKAIALLINLDPDELEAEAIDEHSMVYKAIEEAETMGEMSLNQKQFEDAKLGDKESIRQWKIDHKETKYERYKKKVLFDKEVSKFERLQSAVSSGDFEKLPDDIQQYYEVLDFIRSLFNKLNSRQYIINQVRLRWKEISYSVANKLYYQSINFFNLDNEVKTEAWANVYAELLGKIVALAVDRGELDIAGRYTMEAAKLRGVFKQAPPQIPPEVLERRPILYTTRFRDLGLTPVNRHELAAFIDNLEVSEKEKSRLRRDAQVEEISFEEIVNGEEEDNNQGG